jgi:pimeloyl-ACP methyl ester carboxylesterase
MNNFITFQSQPIHYKSEGLGNVIVLLHGFLESLEIWDDFSKELSTSFQVVTIDLPGHGKSGDLGKIHSIELMAESVDAVLIHLKIKRYVVAGHSMGGYVAIYLAEKYPEKVKGFGFFHSHADTDTAEGKQNRDRVITILRKSHISWVNQFIPDLFAKKNKSPYRKQIKRIQAIAGEMKTSSIIAAQIGMRDRESKLAFLATTPQPVFFIIGKEDSKMTVEKTLEQAVLPKHCEVLMLAGVGHMGFIEAKVATLNFLHGFASGVFKQN